MSCNECYLNYPKRNLRVSFLIGLFSGRIQRVLTVCILSCLAASLSRSASAQSLKPISYGVFVSGQIADLHSTQAALSRGAHEVNPLLRGSFPSIVVKKSLLSAGVLLGSWYLDRHHHEKLANAIRFVGGGVPMVAAIHNNRVGR